MADFTFIVPTDEMAGGLNRVAHRVNDVTGAVREMQNTVILADKAASDNVCANVNRGFYSLIRSQISQKIAKLKADVESKGIEMFQQSQALSNVRQRMEQDYVMIARRYTKLFDTLNKSLRQRIFELDKFTTNFVFHSVATLDNRVKHSSATLIVGTQENISAQQRIISSKTKHIAQLEIEAIKDFIVDIKDQKQHISSILVHRRKSAQIQFHLPVVFSESVVKGVSENSFTTYLPYSKHDILDNKLKWATQNILNDGNSTLKWKIVDSNEKIEVAAELNKIVESSILDERVKNEIMRFFDDSNYQILG